ncbi:MAG TPA: ATP-binding protein, partial [Burkholderiaceae bacterium]|nr:ATP-binding protein [Burkholderiaceae bacterium]
MTRPPGHVIALLGAESTGKTTLARELHRCLQEQGHHVALVEEALRDFCTRLGRTPRSDEQADIARTQSERIADAARTHELVIADTTSMMVAVYSRLLFGDGSLLPAAVAEQSRHRLTLLMALDLPWVADAGIRDGAHVREPVDTLLRNALRDGSVDFSVIAGHGQQRLAHALRAVHAGLNAR